MKENTICSICSIPIDENFCGRCGQKYSSKKLTTLSLLTDIFSNSFYLEKSGLVSILKILTHPRQIVQNYFAGYKNYYASPGKIMVYGIAVLTLHLLLIDTKVMGVSIQINSVAIGLQYTFWVFFYPFLMLISYLSFIRQKLDFSNHIISIVYIATSIFIAVVVISDLLGLVFDELLGNWEFFIFLLLTFYWNSMVFSKKQHVWSYLINTFIQVGIFAAIGGVIVLLNLVFLKN